MSSTETKELKSSSSSSTAPKRVYVTGGNGYIGNTVCRALRAAGHIVYGQIRNSSHSAELIKQEIHPVVGRTSEADIKAYDYIIDTATGGTPSDGKVSEGLLDKVIAWNHANPAKKQYIYTSGCLVLGDYPGQLVTEEAPPKNTAYAWRAELEKKIVKNLHTAIRPGWVYGESGGHYAAPWFKVADPSADIVLKGKPEKKWSWVHVSDLAQAYALAVAAPSTAIAGHIFGVGDSTDMTYQQIRESMARAGGHKGKVVFENTTKPGAIEVTTHMDCSKIARVLGWKPSRTSFANEMDVCYQAWKAFEASAPHKEEKKEEKKESKTPFQIVDAANRVFETTFNTKDGTAVSALYTKEDGRLFPPGTGGTCFDGRTKIATFWDGGIGAGLRPLALKTGSVTQHGDVLIENSTYTHAKGAGAYMVIWKQEEGIWRLWRDLFNA